MQIIVKLRGNRLERNICANIYVGKYEESYAFIGGNRETDILGLDFRVADVCEGPFGEANIIVSDSREPTTVGNGNGYDSEEIKDLFDMEWLINADDEEFRSTNKR